MKTYNIRNVLVPIDSQLVSIDNLQVALSVCTQQAAMLTLIRIVNGYYTLFPSEPGSFYSDFLPELLVRTERSLATIANDLHAEYGVSVDWVVRLGDPEEEISNCAREAKIDLIIMQSRAVSPLRKFILGSSLTRIVQNAPCPVMTVPQHRHFLGFKKILFPVRVVTHALDKYVAIWPFIKKNESSLLIVGIASKSTPTEFRPVGQLVETISHQMIEDHVTCENEMHYCDSPAQQVLDIANLERPDLIVITATQESSSFRSLFNSTYTDEIVNHAQFSVLSIRPDFVAN